MMSEPRLDQPDWTLFHPRKWEGGDPGVAHQKTPTSLLLTPEGNFHSFGYTARDYYHDLDPEEARDWLYFEKFKMKIHSASDLTMKTELEAVNGKKMPALDVFAHALRFFKKHAVQELREQCPSLPERNAIRWVLTVPAIWKQPAKQFMREAAYLAGLVSPEDPEQLLIALEPEAASIYCRKLRLHQLIDLSCRPVSNGFLGERRSIDSSFRQAREQLRRSRHSRTFLVESGVGELWAEMQAGRRRRDSLGDARPQLEGRLTRGDAPTAREETRSGHLGRGDSDCRMAFLGADPSRTHSSRRHLPQRQRKRLPGAHSVPFPHSVNFVKWSSQGMLRMSCEAMNELFQPTVSQIIRHIDELLARPEVQGVKFLFLVGGFAESAVLQHAVQEAFGGRGLRVIIPQDVGLTILKGAVLFGLDPGVVRVRRSPLTYGVGVLNKFVAGRHPPEKLLVKDGKSWCTDVFERFVAADQSVALGEVVQRSYCPARPGQHRILINIYCCAAEDVRYITDPGVRKCGAISLELAPTAPGAAPARREIRASMQFGDTEIKVTAVDVSTSRTVRASIDFLSN
uniref:Heat shock protein family A (Hsp70) member 12B n=1 Tax=Monodelphis domestica TaxID=13616 RepID=F6W1B4_MONDO